MTDDIETVRAAVNIVRDLNPNSWDAFNRIVGEIERLRAEVEALRADAERLDSGCIMMQTRGEFGEVVNVMHVVVDLRAAIDEARQLA